MKMRYNMGTGGAIYPEKITARPGSETHLGSIPKKSIFVLVGSSGWQT